MIVTMEIRWLMPCVGVIDHDMIQKGTAKGEGNSVIYVGLKQVVMVFMVQLLHLKS